MSDAPAKVLIITDIPDSNADSVQALNDAPDFEIVAVAGGGTQAITMAQIHVPDVVVMDYDMPGLDTVETTRAILRENATAQVIMLSVVNDPDDIRTAMRAGAR